MVSVIIPCYNVELFIEECINSVISQTYQNIEIICIDNNSTDSTWSVLENCRKKYPAVIINKELKPGANAARNKGISVCKGEWLQFLDADDLLLPTKIEHQINLPDSDDKNISFIAGASQRKRTDGSLVNNTIIDPDKYTSVFKNQCGNTCSNLWKKEKIISAGGWDEELLSSQEADLMLKLILNGGDYLPDTTPLTIIRERDSGQISQSDPVKRWKRYIDVQLNFLGKLEKQNPFIYKKYQGFYQDSLMVSILLLSENNIEEGDCYYKRYIKPYWKSSHLFGFSPLKVGFIKILGIQLFLKLKKPRRAL